MPERRFLKRRIAKRTINIVQECPDIGEVVEKYLQEQCGSRCLA